MKKILYLIKEKRPLQVRLLALFLILIYLPILFNVFFIQRQTISAVRDDKLVNIEESIQRTAESLDQATGDLTKLLQDRSHQPGIQKGVEDYYLLPEQAQENFQQYMHRQLTDLENNSLYIGHSSVFTLEGDSFSSENLWHEDINESIFYQNLITEVLEEGWHFLASEEIYDPLYYQEIHKEEIAQSLLYVQSIKNLEGNAVVGYMVAIVDLENFMELYQNVYIGEKGRLALWNHDQELLNSKEEESFPLNLRGQIFQSEGFNTLQSQGESMVFYSVSLESFPGSLTASIPEAYLTQSIEGPLRLNLYLMILISTLISIWVFVEIVIISNIASEKETAHYRLTLSEELNEKLRMYKHDFSNHLQIIQGLIQLDHGDRALAYLKKISGQGKMIYDTYEIGIPEIEVVMYDALHRGKREGVEVNIKTMELPTSLGINIYDLVKCLTNLIKNAFEAMALYPEKQRILTIELFEEKDHYVFKISNNLPLISREDQSQIFEKGYTTKELGDGFGLYMVQSLIRKHRGTLDLIVDQEGNHFYLRVPKDK